MSIRSELLDLGVKSVDMIRILDREYGISVNNPNYSASINGKRNGDHAHKIRDACWDYLSKHKTKKQ